MITEKYINLFTDFGFKRIFGTESNKDLLIDFLNAVLGRDQNPILNITYLKNELLGKKNTDRRAIFDLYCESQSNEKFIIELQRAEQEFFRDRALYYTSFSIQEQGKKGKDWNYELIPVYTIAIMDFVFDNQHEDYLSEIKLINTKNQEVFYDKLTFLFLEMPKFKKQRDELKSNTDKWLYIFKNIHIVDKIPDFIKEKMFLKLFEQYEISNYNKKEYMEYEESVKNYNDWFAITQTSEKKGIEKGIRLTAKKMKDKGFDVETICEITGLSEEEIKSL